MSTTTATATEERDAIIAFLRKCRDHWRTESERLRRNPHAAAHCTAKAIVLDCVAKDIEDLTHHLDAP